MSSIGPQLPPQLKRNRDETGDRSTTASNKYARHEGSLRNQDEVDLSVSGSDSEDDYAPSRPSALTAAPPAATARTVGPSLPPHLVVNSNSNSNNTEEIDLSASDSNSDTGPAPLINTNLHPDTIINPDSNSSGSEFDSDDDFGPSLPTSTTRRQIGPSLPLSLDDDETPKRDEWMLAPPPSSTTFTERDTTRIRARKFSSKPKPKPSSSSSAPGAPSIWTETPEEKLRRLQDAVLGRTPSTDAASAGLSDEQLKRVRRDEALAAEIHAQRGKTLLEEHKGSKKASCGKKHSGERGEEDDDDPSKRAFDREKDMAVGGRITSTQRRDLINKSANFGGRFQKGSFL